MKILMGQELSLLAAIWALIGCSPIIVPKPVAGLPDGFTEIDAAVLEWIAAEGRHIGRGSYAHH